MLQILFSVFLIVILLHFLQVAHGSAIQRVEMDNVPCLDVGAVGGDCSCDTATPPGPIGTGEKEFVLKEGNIELDVSPVPKSIHSEQQADLEKDNHEPRSTFLQLELRDSCAEAPSPGNRQLNCANPDSPLSVLFKFPQATFWIHIIYIYIYLACA